MDVMNSDFTDAKAVQEVQGLYGPFSLSERILQKIWLTGDYHQQDLRTISGKTLKVLDAGAWNKNEGPDFKEACLELDGRRVVGDVEIHFYVSDWFHHGHDQNPNFRNVVLHVVLYAVGAEAEPGGPGMETLVLLPLLERDLEEYAMEAALLDLERVNDLVWVEFFLSKPVSERRALIEDSALRRWEQKVGFARKRLARSDWSTCCHTATLEVMGFSRNRGVMHKIANRYAIGDFANGLEPEEVYREYQDAWKLSGCRPANHPRLRLQQYVRICTANREWPQQLLEAIQTVPQASGGDENDETASFRKYGRTRELQQRLAQQVFQGCIGEKRLNTLLCDMLFPLLSGTLPDGDWQSYWRHWYPGDFPEVFACFYRDSGLAHARQPMSNGALQGILSLFASEGGGLLSDKTSSSG